MTGLPNTVRLKPDTPDERVSLDDPRYRGIQLFALLVIPLIQLAVNPNAFINPGAHLALDPWVYTGFFYNLPSYLSHWGFTYYSTRLSWLLPGFVAHRLLPPLAANYALHLFFFYTLLWVTYLFLASGAGRHLAMLGILLLAWSPAVLTAISWDYVDGAGIVYLMATLLCIERAVNGRHDVAWSVAAGCAVACLLVANVVLVLLLPACGMFLFLRARGVRWPWAVRSLAAAVAGAVVTIAVFAAVNRGLGGRWLFLEGSIRFAAVMWPAPNPWRNTGFRWSQAVWLAVPISAAAGSILMLAIPSIERRPFPRAVQAASLTAIATWVAMDFVTQHTALLQHRYYVSYLVPLALIALPLQAGDLTTGRGWRAALTIELAVFGALAVAHIGFLWYGDGFWTWAAALFGPAYALEKLTAITVVVTAAGLITVGSLRFARRSVLWGAVVVSGIAFVYAAPHLWREAGGPYARTRFTTVADAHHFIGKHVDSSTVRFWYRVSPQDTPPFQSIACTYLLGYVLVNEDMPHLSVKEAATLRPDTRLVLLLNRRDEENEARAALRRFGFDYSVVTGQQFGAGNQAYFVLIAELMRVPQISRR